MELNFRGINFREFAIFENFAELFFEKLRPKNSQKLIPRIFNSVKIKPFKVVKKLSKQEGVQFTTSGEGGTPPAVVENF